MKWYELQGARALSLVAGLGLGACGGDSDTPPEPSPTGKVDISASGGEIKADFDQPQQLQLTVKNTGSVALSNLTPKPSSPMMRETANTCAAIALDVNASCTLSYLIKPTEPGQGSLGVELLFSHQGVTGKGSVSVPYKFSASQWAALPAWGNAQGNASHTGYVPVSLQASSFKLDWEHTPARADLTLIGVTSDKERIYATVRQETPVIPGVSGKIHVSYALSMQDGSMAWQSQLGPSGAPAVLGDEVFVAFPSPLNNQIWHLDAKTGEYLDAERYGTRSEPAVVPVIWEQGRYYMTPSTYRGVWAILPGSSIQTWLFEPKGIPADLSVDAQYVYWAEDDAYITSSDFIAYKKMFVAIKRLTGEPAFEIEMPGVPSPTVRGPNHAPVLDETSTRAFVSVEGLVVALDLRTRAVLWQVSDLSGHPSYNEQTVFVASTDARKLNALHAGTGAVQWTWQAPEAISSAIVATKTHLFVASSNTTYAINRASHQQEWSHPAGGSLLISNTGKLIISADNGKVSAISLR